MYSHRFHMLPHRLCLQWNVAFNAKTNNHIAPDSLMLPVAGRRECISILTFVASPAKSMFEKERCTIFFFFTGVTLFSFHSHWNNFQWIELTLSAHFPYTALLYAARVTWNHHTWHDGNDGNDFSQRHNSNIFAFTIIIFCTAFCSATKVSPYGSTRRNKIWHSDRYKYGLFTLHTVFELFPCQIHLSSEVFECISIPCDLSALLFSCKNYRFSLLFMMNQACIVSHHRNVIFHRFYVFVYFLSLWVFVALCGPLWAFVGLPERLFLGNL